MIPHDHHSDCSVFNKDNECHADNVKLPANAPVFPIHCHALNDLTFEKTSPAFVVFNDFPTCDLFTLSFFDTAISNAASADFIIKDFPIPLIEADFLRLSPFRAPPVLV